MIWLQLRSTPPRPPDTRLLRRTTEPVRRFLGNDTSAGMLLLAGTALSLLIINSPVGREFSSVLEAPVGISLGDVHFHRTLHEWVNEGLMTVFFFVAGLEIKQELTNGELSDKRKAALPVIAAFCGMVVPALVYFAFNPGDAAKGWAIPMATDIAFVLGVISLAGSRVPPAAKIFLLTLAVADDVGSIVALALFYSSSLSVGWLLSALAGLGLVLYLRANDIRSIPVYIAVGTVIWLCTLHSGIPPTLVGVAMGLLAPARHHPADATTRTITERIQSFLSPWSSYVILPVFALVNAGVVVTATGIGEALTSPVAIGIVLARTAGKAIGIAGGVWLCVRLGIAPLPKNTTWAHIGGIALSAGAGFTVSLLVTELAFGDGVLAEQAKLGILVGTVISAVVGLAVLRRSSPAKEDEVTR